jgi:CBS domain-containing protein
MSQQSNPIKDHLHSILVKDLIPESKDGISSLKANDTVENLIKIMSTKGYQSVPIITEGDASTFVSVNDLVNFIIKSSPNEDSLTNAAALQIAFRVFRMVSVGRVAEMSETDTISFINENAKASSLLPILAKTHRVLVVSNEGAYTGVVSQSAVVSYLANQIHMGAMKNMGLAALDQFNYGGETSVISIPETATFLDAMKALNTNKVSCLAVVDVEGQLVGNFSASDLRGLYSDNFPHLAEPLKNFLASHSAASLHPILVKNQGTLLDNIKILTTNQLHHIWKVENGKPTGIFSVSDVIHLVQNWDSAEQNL